MTTIGASFPTRSRLLKQGGRLGIVLPETYFFSVSYRWFGDWMNRKFILRGVLNIPMEAFQGFCRAKTNFYVFEKRAEGSAHEVQKPRWFRNDSIWVSYAPTIGVNKDGLELYRIDEHGQRTNEIDDKAIEDVGALLAGRGTNTCSFVSVDTRFAGVPQYSNRESLEAFEQYVRSELTGFSLSIPST